MADASDGGKRAITTLDAFIDASDDFLTREQRAEEVQNESVYLHCAVRFC